VEALGGAPGIFSARFGNLETDRERNDLLLAKLDGVPSEKRGARFVCVMALVFPDGKEYIERGECRGSITMTPSGRKGFGYDPVFFVQERNCTMAELQMAEKDLISHRGIALRAMVALIEKISAE
jgi:XTP/dITP diphosphohydrolase